MNKLAIATAGITLSLGVAVKPSLSAQFDFSYSGNGVQANGVLTTTDLDPTNNTYKIVDITGQRNGEQISALIPDSQFANNDNILNTTAPLLTFSGLSYFVGPLPVNVFFALPSQVGLIGFTGYAEQSGLNNSCGVDASSTGPCIQLSSFSVKPVPEPSSTLATLAFGAVLGTGVALKRQLKKSSLLNFNKIALVTGLVVSGILVSSVVAPAEAAILWNFSYTGSGVTASGLLTTNNFDPTVGAYEITGITGTRNGVNITGLVPNPNYPKTTDTSKNSKGSFFTYDNQLLPSPDLLDGPGLLYTVTDGTEYNVYNNGSSAGSPIFYDFSIAQADAGNFIGTPISLSISAVPEPSSILGTLFFGAISAGYLLKRKSCKVA